MKLQFDAINAVADLFEGQPQSIHYPVEALIARHISVMKTLPSRMRRVYGCSALQYDSHS